MIKTLLKKNIPSFLLNWYHFILALLGAIFYCFPSKGLRIIGVTGTNGKSTVVELAARILEEAGYKVASFSTVKFKIGEKEWPNALKMTMPGRLKVQRFLRQAVNAVCQYAVLEVTSEGIKQYRHKFIDFDIAAFTNLTPEHIEAHGRFENYRAAKGKLFRAAKGIHIVNSDDENAEYFLGFSAKEKWTYSLKEIKSPNYRLAVSDCRVGPDGISFKVQDTQFNSHLIGEFNIYNALAAISLGLSQRVSLETCRNTLAKIEGIPGRMEEVVSQPFKVFVDYAFTPNALEKVYRTLKDNFNFSGNPTILKDGDFPKNQDSKGVPPLVSGRGSESPAREIQFTPPRLICLLGACGGGRDKWKRPVLGEIAAVFCDEIIVTNEDPYDEEPMEIIEQVAKGAENISINQFTPLDNLSNGAGQYKSAVHKILDRREAISKALGLAKPGDTVIITGKGCEPWICIANGKKIPWDDRSIVKEEFKKLYDEKI